MTGTIGLYTRTGTGSAWTKISSPGITGFPSEYARPYIHGNGSSFLMKSGNVVWTLSYIQNTQQPSGQPTGQPSNQPTCVPTGQPTNQPTSQPTCQPTGQPTSQPTYNLPNANLSTTVKNNIQIAWYGGQAVLLGCAFVNYMNITL